MTRTMTFASILAASLSLTAVAHADPDSPWVAGIEIGPRWRDSASWDAFSTAVAAPATGLFVGRDVSPSQRLLVVGVELGWGLESGHRTLRQAYDATLNTHSLHAAASLRVRLPFARWLQPYARVSGGALYHDGRLDPESDGAALFIDDWTWHVGTGGGLSVTTAPFLRGIGWRSARFTALVEAGYRWTGAPTLVATTGRSSNDPDAIPTTPVNLGSLSVAGPYLRVAVGLRF
ncbi:MAG: hypothetical protein R3A52_07200 [Polyangiales bacterium]